MTKINKVRSALYKTGRVLGDVNAIQRKKIPQRIGRRIVGKIIGKGLSRFFK